MALEIRSLRLQRVPAVAAVWTSGDPSGLGGAKGADLIEVRWDLFPERALGSLAELLDKATAESGLPLLFTARGDRERGDASVPSLPEAFRHAAYAKGLQHATAVDVEYASEDLRRTVIEQAHHEKHAVILSMHDFEKTPPLSVLQEFAERAREAGADIVKVATMARGEEDVERLCRLAASAGGEPIIAVPMGSAVPDGRYRVLSHGALLAYAAIDTGSAPGQAGVPEVVAKVRELAGQ